MKRIPRVFMAVYVVAMMLAAFAGRAVASAVMDNNSAEINPPVVNSAPAGAPAPGQAPVPQQVAAEPKPVRAGFSFMGRIERMEAGRWIVSGKVITTAGAAFMGGFKKGDLVNISGVDQPDGSIAAFSVEATGQQASKGSQSAAGETDKTHKSAHKSGADEGSNGSSYQDDDQNETCVSQSGDDDNEQCGDHEDDHDDGGQDGEGSGQGGD